MQLKRMVVITCCFGVMVVSSAGLRSQGPRRGPGPGFPGDGFGPGSQGGPGFLGGLGKVVTSRPYSAQVTTEFVQTLADGSQIHRVTTNSVYRDSQGRVRREQTMPNLASYDAPGNPPKVIFVDDPQAGAGWVLDPVHKTGRKLTIGQWKPSSENQQPPPRGNADNSQRPQRGNSNAGVITESLGSQPICDGLYSSQGTRITRKIPPNSRIGNDHEIQIITERWYAADLGINTQTKTIDPLHGTTTTNLTSLTCSEPAPALFQVDTSVYSIRAGGPGPGGRRPHPGPPPPPNPQQ